MFTIFSSHKLNYSSGQVFPFLIAMICVLIGLLMMTVNLGQISVYRTEVSNAADAGALAAASVLSGVLLNIGLVSDTMCSFGIVSGVYMCIAALKADFPENLLYVLGVYLATMSRQVGGNFIGANEAGIAGWLNAKKSAIQYAFQNLTIDEPRPAFDDFVRLAYNQDVKALSKAGNQTLINTYYSEYSKGVTANARKYGSSGYSKFMADPKSGYWKESWGDSAKPGDTSPEQVNSGYGWTWQKDGTGNYDMKSSYEADNTKGWLEHNHKLMSGQNTYDKHENYAEVQVNGFPSYALNMFKLGDVPILGPILALVMLVVCIIVAVKNFATLFQNLGDSWWGALIAVIIVVIIILVLMYLFWNIPAGITLNKPKGLAQGGTEGQDSQVDNRYIKVTVRRHRTGKASGLWTFDYGKDPTEPTKPEVIEAVSKSHVFKEKVGGGICNSGDDCSTVNPSIIAGSQGEMVNMFTGLFTGSLAVDAVKQLFTNDYSGWFDTRRHLFETGLSEVQ